MWCIRPWPSRSSAWTEAHDGDAHRRSEWQDERQASPALVSIRSYAAMRDAAPSTIRYAISTGLIKLVDGRVDCRQADESWSVHRRGRYLTHRGAGRNTAHQGANARGAAAKLRRLRARLALARDNLAQSEDRYCRRDEALAKVTAEGRFVLDRLRALPDERPTLGRRPRRVALGGARDPRRVHYDGDRRDR